MELVSTVDDAIPPGRPPIFGGHESDGSRVYHAMTLVSGIWVPSKTGGNMVCVPSMFTNVSDIRYLPEGIYCASFDGIEHVVRQYDLQ